MRATRSFGELGARAAEGFAVSAIGLISRGRVDLATGKLCFCVDESESKTCRPVVCGGLSAAISVKTVVGISSKAARIALARRISMLRRSRRIPSTYLSGRRLVLSYPSNKRWHKGKQEASKGRPNVETKISRVELDSKIPTLKNAPQFLSQNRSSPILARNFASVKKANYAGV